MTGPSANSARSSHASDDCECVSGNDLSAKNPPAAAALVAPPPDAAPPTPPPDAAVPAFFMYVLSCVDGTLYTGYTNDVEQRVRAHNAGKGAKYTRSRTPVEVLAQARFATKREAMSAEFHFKRLSRRAKDALLARARSEDFAEILGQLCNGAGISDGADSAGAEHAVGNAADVRTAAAKARA